MLESSIYCFACDTVQHAGFAADHFALLGLPPAYAMDRAAMDAAYQRLTLAMHPDFYASGEPGQLAAAERVSARVNDAYRTLAADSARAAYLVQLWAAGRNLDTRRLPEGFLQAVFLLQEEIEDLDEGDGAQRERLRRETAEKLAAVRERRDGMFSQVERGGGVPDDEALQALQTNLNEENYLARLHGRLAE